MKRSRDAAQDRGFTLIEVVVTVAMMALVAGVIAAAVIVVFRSETGIVATTSESHDTQQVVSYLPLDIESGPIRAEAYRAVVGGAPGDRGSGCDETGNDNVLRIDVTDRRATLIDKRIAYRIVTTANEARLDRYECTFDGTVWNTQGVVNVADYLDPNVSPVAESEVVVSNPADPIGDQLVDNVALRYVQRGDAESITASPREEQPLDTSGVCGSDPMSAAKNIAVFVEGDVELHNTTVASSLFVGGVLTFHGGSVAQANPPAPDAPVPGNVGLVAGSIDWAGSSGELDVKPHRDVLIEDGNYFIAGDEIRENSTSSVPHIDLGAAATVIPPGAQPLVEPGEAFAELRACADRLAELPDSCNNSTCAAHAALPPGYSGTATDAGNTRLDLASGKANAFNIDESNLADLQTIQLQFAPGDSPSADTPLIINVASDATVSFEAPTIQGSGTNSIYVVWNFPNAESVEILSGNELRGTVMAPYADVTSYTDIEGGVIARTFEMFGSSLSDVRYFQGTLGW